MVGATHLKHLLLILHTFTNGDIAVLMLHEVFKCSVVRTMGLPMEGEDARATELLKLTPLELKKILIQTT